MSNKIALITGGSRGLGKDMALRMAKDGHDVVITYVSKKDAAAEVVKEIEAMGMQAAALFLDVNNITSFSQFIDEFRQILKAKWNTESFDFLVNNAGIGATIPYLKVTEADFDQFINIHFKSVYFLTQQLLPLVNDNGRIINISSGTTRFCVPGYSVYASVKGAVEVFTRYLAKDVGARGITANVVAPGPVETDFNNGGNRDIPERKKFLASMTALGRVGQPKDIGGIIAFLCSEDGGWISGQRIEVSGGINL
ncbi:MAG: SDR family oxidoreductase [Bacteroidota bacterium]|nr:SDR family oxidoreductase [Bacteroidota bacterium]